MVIVAVCALCALAACGYKDSKGSADKGDQPAPPAAADPAPANAAIPAAWKGKLEFESRTITTHDETVSVPGPKGGKAGHMPNGLEPANGSTTFGFGTTFSAGKTCGGACEDKPADKWEKAANSSFFDNMLAHTPAPKVYKDEKTPGHRVLIAEDQYTGGNVNSTTIMMAWWKDGADRFYYCNVTLAPESKDLVSAFEQACAKLVVAF